MRVTFIHINLLSIPGFHGCFGYGPYKKASLPCIRLDDDRRDSRAQLPFTLPVSSYWSIECCFTMLWNLSLFRGFRPSTVAEWTCLQMDIYLRTLTVLLKKRSCCNDVTFMFVPQFQVDSDYFGSETWMNGEVSIISFGWSNIVTLRVFNALDPLTLSLFLDPMYFSWAILVFKYSSLLLHAEAKTGCSTAELMN